MNKKSNIGVYQIKNLINEKVYIGSSIRLKKRWIKHRWQLNAGKHANLYLQNSWNKYSEKNFVFEVLENCEKEVLIFREQLYIDQIKPYKKENGYNLRKKAENNLGVKRRRDLVEKYRGENHPQAKLTWKQVNEIRETYKNGLSDYRNLAKKYRVSFCAIECVVTNRTWTDENYFYEKRKIAWSSDSVEKVSGENSYRAKLTWADVEKIRELYQQKNQTQKKIAAAYNISREHVRDIILNKKWKDADYTLPKSNKERFYKRAKEIREKYQTENVSFNELAKMFNLSYSNIQQIIENKIWKDEKYRYIKNRKRNCANGEKNSQAKLTWEQVTEIRNLYKNKKYTQREIAEKFNISRVAVSSIILNKRWKIK